MIRRTKKERKKVSCRLRRLAGYFLNIWLGGFIGILMSYIDRVSHIHKQKRRVTDMTNKNIYQNTQQEPVVIFILGLWDRSEPENLRLSSVLWI